MPITVRPVASRRDLRRFIDLPFRLYEDNPYWVPPLRMDVKHLLSPKKNAFFGHGHIQPFVAEDDSGTVVGRIAGIENGMHLQKYEDGTGFFGFFETVEDYAVAEALLDAASAWLRERGLAHVRGPANPSLNDVAGLLVRGFNRSPFLLMPYNPPYYEEYLTRFGFRRVMTMWALYLHHVLTNFERMQRGSAIIRRRNPSVTLRTLDMTRFDDEARTILDIYNDAWSENWGHVPMTDAEFGQLAKELKQIVDPEIVFILEDDGRPVAFCIGLPDVNQLLKRVTNGRLFPFGLAKILLLSKCVQIDEMRVPLMGVRKSHQGRGLDTLLMAEIVAQGDRKGYTGAEMSWLLETNKPIVNALQSLGGVIDKEYAMLEKDL